MFAPASSKRSKNSRSFGANSCDRLAMGASVCKRLVIASCRAVAPSGDRRTQALEFLRGDPVGVLGARELAVADLLRVRAHALDHGLADRRVLLDELRLEAGVDRQQVVQDEDLAVR